MKIAKVAARAAVEAVRLVRNGFSDNGRGPDASGLLPGQATIVEADGEPVGVFCDAAGRLRAVRARCTHIDWELEFDHTSQTWDCPLHGAKFGIDGAVVRGPATRTLETVCLPDDVSAALSLTRPREGERGVDAQ